MAICPLLRGAECKRADCQWYVSDMLDCAVRVLAGEVGELLDSVKSIAEGPASDT
ncbi:MAG: hypothetical protein ABSG74_02890 [Candidatus Bathyarchaeia archaeon]|jgi:hypothetical protein